MKKRSAMVMVLAMGTSAAIVMGQGNGLRTGQGQGQGRGRGVGGRDPEVREAMQAFREEQQEVARAHRESQREEREAFRAELRTIDDPYAMIDAIVAHHEQMQQAHQSFREEQYAKHLEALEKALHEAGKDEAEVETALKQSRQRHEARRVKIEERRGDGVAELTALKSQEDLKVFDVLDALREMRPERRRGNGDEGQRGRMGGGGDRRGFPPPSADDMI